MTRDYYAKILWEYQLLHHTLKKADVIFALGTYDLAVPRYAAQLFLDGWAPMLAFSGYKPANSEMKGDLWEKSEAETFKDVALTMGVPEDKILIETEARNTQQNFEMMDDVFRAHDVNPKTVILVQKPYMERRVWATGLVRWPQRELIMTSPPISFEEYIARTDIPLDRTLCHLVGDTERIKLYSENGFLAPQEMPEEVWAAYEALVSMRYTKNLLAP